MGKSKPRHLDLQEFTVFWRKFTKIYQTIDNDGSGEIEFEELLRYLKITVKKQRISKEMGLNYKTMGDRKYLSVMLIQHRFFCKSNDKN